MSVKLITLDSTQTLANQLTAVRQTEALGFELITVARGVVAGQPSNTATLRRLAPGTPPGPLTMVEVPGAESLLQQNGDANAGEAGGKMLISYAAIFVSGNETNVAAYRG